MTHLLSIILFLPLVAMLIMSVLPAKQVKWAAMGMGILQLALWVIIGYPMYQSALSAGNIGVNKEAAFALAEKLPWISLQLGEAGKLSIEYFVGVDGLSFLMVLLTLIVLPIAILAAWNTEKNIKSFFMLLMLLDTAMIGCFVALDFFLFYLFYELMLLPMFFLIGLWGGPRREYAAIKFFLYTLVGSVFLLLVMVGLAFSFADKSGTHTFNMIRMMEVDANGTLIYLVKGSVFDFQSTLFGVDARLLAFMVSFIAFAIKVPAVPLHTWLPDAHVEAPTAISVILAGVLLKVGGYGILRISYGIFPEGAVYFAKWIAVIGVISMLYGALVAMAQKDYKSMIAYSSISHLGYTLLGMASLETVGMNGVVLQLFNHGLTASMLFLLVGVVYDRVHTREIEKFKGLWSKMPHYAFFTLIAFFASLGLPGFNAFVSELFIFSGAFAASAGTHLIPLWLTAISVLAIVLGAVYFLRTYRSMFFGTFEAIGSEDWEGKLTDLSPREYLLLIPLAIMLVAFGLYPQVLIDMMDKSVAAFVEVTLKNGQAFLLK